MASLMVDLTELWRTCGILGFKLYSLSSLGTFFSLHVAVVLGTMKNQSLEL